MLKRKGGDKRKQTLNARIYPVVSVDTKSLPGLLLACHKGSATKIHAKSFGHLDAAFTMELSTKEESPCPPHKTVVTALHQAEGSKTRRRVKKTPRGQHTEITAEIHSRISTRS
jgi:hypothetical protein